MKTMIKLMMVIGLVSIVSCSTPTTPIFPKIDCAQIKLTKEELSTLKVCKKDTICNIEHSLLKKFNSIIQVKSQCLEEYKAAASKFK